MIPYSAVTDSAVWRYVPLILNTGHLKEILHSLLPVPADNIHNQ